MSTSTIVLLCLQALLVQNAFSQCLNRAPGYGLAYEAEAVSTGYGAINGYGPYGFGNTGLVGSGFDLFNGYAINANEFGYGAGLNIGYGAGWPYGYGAGLPIGYGAGWPYGYGAGLPIGYGAGVPSVAATASIPVTGPFIANGFGDLVVGGEFGVGGTTVVGGQIPVIGAVSFGGQIPAGGVVSIAGNCGCAAIPL